MAPTASPAAKKKMRISATGNKHRLKDRGECGFSLVELVVAMMIIGLLASAVVLTMPDPQGRLVDAGEAFAARARAAQEAAIVESRDMAMWVSPAGYGFERYEEGGWVAVAREPFEDRSWPENAEASVIRQSDERTRIIFDATGLNDPLDLTLARDGETISVAIGADGTIRVDG